MSRQQVLLFFCVSLFAGIVFVNIPGIYGVQPMAGLLPQHKVPFLPSSCTSGRQNPSTAPDLHVDAVILEPTASHSLALSFNGTTAVFMVYPRLEWLVNERLRLISTINDLKSQYEVEKAVLESHLESLDGSRLWYFLSFFGFENPEKMRTLDNLEALEIVFARKKLQLEVELKEMEGFVACYMLAALAIYVIIIAILDMASSMFWFIIALPQKLMDFCKKSHQNAPPKRKRASSLTLNSVEPHVLMRRPRSGSDIGPNRSSSSQTLFDPIIITQTSSLNENVTPISTNSGLGNQSLAPIQGNAIPFDVRLSDFDAPFPNPIPSNARHGCVDLTNNDLTDQPGGNPSSGIGNFDNTQITHQVTQLHDELQGLAKEMAKHKTQSTIFMAFLTYLFEKPLPEGYVKVLTILKHYWVGETSFDSCIEDARAILKSIPIGHGETAFTLVRNNTPFPSYIKDLEQEFLLGNLERLGSPPILNMALHGNRQVSQWHKDWHLAMTRSEKGLEYEMLCSLAMCAIVELKHRNGVKW